MEDRNITSQKLDNLIRERNVIRSQHKEIFEKILDILFQYDPVGAAGMSEERDEYSPEVGTIIPRLYSANSVEDVHEIIYSEFCQWFDTYTGEKEKYYPVAVEIWKVWQMYRE